MSSDRTVHCPRREQSVRMHECVACPDCHGVQQDGSGARVVCRHAPEGAEAASRRRHPTSAARLPLSAIMTRDVVCVRPDVHLSTLTALLVDRGYTGVPVVDDEGRAIGVVSRSDLVRAQFEEPGREGEAVAFDALALDLDLDLEPGFHLEPGDGVRVSDVMMPMAFTLPENASLSQAAALMAYERIHRVPVVTTTGAVVGIVTAMDVVRWLAEHDGYLVRARNAG